MNKNIINKIIKIIIGVSIIIFIISGLMISNNIYDNGLNYKITVLKKKILKTCYIGKTKSNVVNVPGKETEKEFKYTDIKYLELIRKPNSEVEGLLNYLPAYKDSIRGSFTGVISNKYLNIIYSPTLGASVERKEQKIFRVYNDLIIESKYSEKKLIEGVYMFKDIKKIVFEDDGFFLKVDCSAVDKKEVKIK